MKDIRKKSENKQEAAMRKFRSTDATFTLQWLVYMPQSLTRRTPPFCSHRIFTCSVWILEQKQLFLYTG
jgi:hypothetical protein